jgi:hypothetical protein
MERERCNTLQPVEAGQEKGQIGADTSPETNQQPSNLRPVMHRSTRFKVCDHGTWLAVTNVVTHLGTLESLLESRKGVFANIKTHPACGQQEYE